MRYVLLIFVFLIIFSNSVIANQNISNQQTLVIKFVDSLTLEPVVNSKIDIEPIYTEINLYGIDEDYLYYHTNPSLFNGSYTIEDIKAAEGIIKKEKIKPLFTNQAGEITLSNDAYGYNFRSDKADNINYVKQSDSIITSLIKDSRHTIYLNPIFDIEVKLETDFNFLLSFFRRFRYGSYIESPSSELNIDSKIEPNCFMTTLQKGETINQYSDKLNIRAYFERDLNSPTKEPFVCYVYAWESLRDVGGIKHINFEELSRTEVNVLTLPLDTDYDEIIREIDYQRPVSNTKITEVNGLTIKNNGIGRSIFLTWNKSDESSKYAIARAKVVSNEYYKFETIPNDPKNNFAVDYNTESGSWYEYRVFSYLGDSFTLDNTGNISGVQIEAKENDASNERVIFVVPADFSDGSDNLENVLRSLIDDVNDIYSDTNKRFTFAGIKLYDSNLCNIDGCDAIFNDARYVEPGALIVYYTPLNNLITSAYTLPYTLPTVLIGPESVFVKYLALNTNTEEMENYRLISVYTLGHEITHTFGAGIPEYYIYQSAQDTSNIVPIIRNISLNEKYSKDIMNAVSLQPSEYKFSPLTISIINNNLDHSNVIYLNQDFESMHPSRISINVKSNNLPLDSVKVDVYCIDMIDIRQNSETPIPLLVEIVNTNENGEVVFDILKIKDQLSGGQCEVVGFKAYGTDSTSASFITQTELQEVKIVNSRDIAVVNIGM